MKRILGIIGFLLFATSQPVLAGPPFMLQLVAGGTPLAGGGTEYYAENFDPTYSTNCATAPGYEYEDLCTNETLGGGNLLDQDAASGQSGECFKFDSNDGEADCYTYDTFTEITTGYYIELYFKGNDFAANFDQVPLFYTQDGTTTPGSLVGIALDIQEVASAYRVRLGNGTASVNIDSTKDSNWHRLRIYDPSDGSTTIKYKLDAGSEQDTAVASTARDPDTIILGGGATQINDDADNDLCTGEGNPSACCSGSGTGTCAEPFIDEIIIGDATACGW